MAASGRFDVPCWCQSVVVDPAALARLPADRLGKACLCRRCTEATASATAKD
ncbi:cysteine-rich CWC family protein [Hydrocarboniphaga sp.]|uniref:cysteine-rich CWC family protein n=1 Tax=Hydrocarboniphaga sp. TaxID=2033016 RepID=UPI003D129726